MSKIFFKGLMFSMAAALFVGCWGNRYVSADADLEDIYMGRSYYDIVGDFGNPDLTTQDEEGGSRITYNCVTLRRTSAAPLYKQYKMRNRNTKEEGTPSAKMTFSFNARMKCYAVESEFQRAVEKKQPEAPVNPNQWSKPRVPRSLDFPFVKSRSPYAEPVSIEKIEVERDKTVIYFSYCARTPDHRPLLYDKGLSINKDVFLRDCATGQHIKFVSAEGITIYPVYTQFAHNRGGYDVLIYSLTFEALPLNTENIDIVEPGAEGFNFYGVDVKTPLSFNQSKKANPIPESK